MSSAILMEGIQNILTINIKIKEKVVFLIESKNVNRQHKYFSANNSLLEFRMESNCDRRK